VNKVTVIVVVVGVSVKEGEDPTQVLTRVSGAAYEFKKVLGEVEVFNIQSREVAAQAPNAQSQQ
jgi:hypothetical protein